MDDIPTWEAHGTSYGFSSFGVPTTHPGIDPFNEGISVWVDEKIQSKLNMATLAEYGVDMDHPCVRACTEKEVDANRKFLVASFECFKMRELLRVRLFDPCHHYPSSNVPVQTASPENLRSGRVIIKVPNQMGGPEAFFELLKKKQLATEEKRDELKPLWLREWQDSQRPGQSTTP